MGSSPTGGTINYRGVAQLVAHLFWEQDVGDSSSSIPTIYIGDVAQLGERCPCKAEVEGSTPFVSTNLSVGGNDGGVALVCKTNPSG